MLGEILLIVFGLLLIIVEVALIPGTTFVGIIGFVMTMIGVWQGYTEHGVLVGSLMLGSVIVISALTFWLCIKYEVWSWFALKDKMSAKVNEDLLKEVEVGQTGTTLSVLRPAGKASINGKELEVHTRGLYVEPGTAVRIVSVEQYKIVVEPIS